MKIILKWLKPFYLRMSVGLLIKISATLVELVLPYILSHILKNVVVTQRIERILLWGGMMVLCAFLACVFNIIANRMAAYVSSQFAEKMRHRLFERMLTLSSRQVDKFTVPSLESRITSDTYNVHHFVDVIQRMGVRAPIMLFGGLAITLVMDSFLAVAMFSVLPFIFITVVFISRKGIPLYVKVQEGVDRLVRVVREDAQGIRVIKALSKVEYEHRRFEDVNSDLCWRQKKVGSIMGAVNPVMTLIMNVGITAVIALGANRVAGNQSDVETVIAFMQYFTMISMAMMGITRIFNMYTKSTASARRILEVIDTPEDLKVESEEKYPPKKTDAIVCFDEVSFSYNGKRKNLDDVSFVLKEGQSLGVIGSTGSGKTTLVKLLMRLYDTDKGSIYVEGKDVRTYEKQELYSMFASVTQQDFLFADTVRENILLGRSATDEEIEFAARNAQAYEFISAFDEKFEHMLSQKGTNISGGQKQRLLIARALLKKPKILVLDDSSSALDYKTDAQLRKAIKENYSLTLITVAQRVSSIKDCDLIIVLDEGRIIGMGKHEELLEKCNEYREISESQMGGAIIE